jgi:hypothetical protein
MRKKYLNKAISLEYFQVFKFTRIVKLGIFSQTYAFLILKFFVLYNSKNKSG